VVELVLLALAFLHLFLKLEEVMVSLLLLELLCELLSDLTIATAFFVDFL